MRAGPECLNSRFKTVGLIDQRSDILRYRRSDRSAAYHGSCPVFNLPVTQDDRFPALADSHLCRCQADRLLNLLSSEPDDSLGVGTEHTDVREKLDASLVGPVNHVVVGCHQIPGIVGDAPLLLEFADSWEEDLDLEVPGRTNRPRFRPTPDIQHPYSHGSLLPDGGHQAAARHDVTVDRPLPMVITCDAPSTHQFQRHSDRFSCILSISVRTDGLSPDAAARSTTHHDSVLVSDVQCPQVLNQVPLAKKSRR